MIVAPVAVAALLLLAGPAPAFADSCPNAQFRTGYSAYLPDCRAYELVSPAGSRPYLSTDNPPTVNFSQASSTGGGIGWFSFYPLAGSQSDGMYYLSTRTSAGWSTTGAIPPQSQVSANLIACEPSVYYSPDLSRGVLSDGFDGQLNVGGGSCGGDDPPLVAGEPQGVRNLFVWDPSLGSYQLVVVNSAGAPPSAAELGSPPGNAEFQAASADFSHVVFEDDAQLTLNAPSGVDLYEWSSGAVDLVSVLPDGTPVAGTLVNPASYVDPAGNGVGPGSFAGAAPFTGAVSSDGERVFFDADGNLYVRENADQPQSPVSGGACTVGADACTVQVDASQAGGSGGGGTFMWASSDGSLIYFSDGASAGLTSDTVAGSGTNLYRYDVDTGQLTDLTPAADAQLQGVGGVSSDGSYVYFVADGALASGATAGQPNLYLDHAGIMSFIATLAAGDSGDWGAGDGLSARVSPSGEFIGFDSVASLTGYDNTDASTGNPDDEIYLYDAAMGKLACVSCDSSGAAPTGPAAIPAPEQMANYPAPGYLQRNVLDDGRVFFDSPDELLPGASDGHSNVYESEPDGVGGCAQAGGCLDLISSGTSANPSFFYDASASGNDVFILTSQDLLGGGGDGTESLYDARVDGGFPASATAGPPCGDTATCEGSSAAPPSLPSVGSVSFSGPGNSPAGTRGSAKVRVTRKLVRGDAFVLTVNVPAKGRITITGVDVTRASRLVARAGSYRITVRLIAKARRELDRRHRLKVVLHVRYAPAGGPASAATATLTLKRAARSARARQARAAGDNLGGRR